MADRIPGADLLILEDCGHLASMEQPERLTRELERLFALDAQQGKTHAIQ
jgi:pimeloyl-ACP methyl ester carboxylesterase